MVIYFKLDDNGHLNGWSSTSSSDDDIRLYVEDNHEVLNNPFIFKYVDGELIKDEDKQQQMIDEQEAQENKPRKEEENAKNIEALTEAMIELLS